MQRLQAWVTGRPLLRQVLGNAGWLATDRILRLGLGVLISAWTARHFGPSLFGVLNFSLAIVVIFGSVAALGLETVVVRDLVRMPGRRAEILASALALRVLGGIVAIVACMATIGLLRPDEGATAQVVGVLALGLLPQVMDVVDHRYQAAMKSRPVILLRSGTFLVFAVVRCLVLLNQGTLLDLALASTAEVLCAAILLGYLAYRDGNVLRPTAATASECARLLRQSWPLAVSAVSVAIYMRIDQLMLGELADDRAVGVFSAAVRISEAWFLVPMSLMASVAPVLAANYVRSASGYRDLLARFGRSIVWLAVGVALLLSLLAPRLIQLIYGSEYGESAQVLVIHAWAGVFFCLGILASDWLLNAGLARYSMYQAMIGAGVNVLLNWWLIPAYGAVGAAIATLAGYIVSTFLLHSVARATRPIFFLQLRMLRWS
ncbi:MAG: flippase [Chromatiales bacterium]|nr:flippase [Chromatiales bacterium]